MPEDRAGEVVYMATPLAREAVLAGYTYKLKWAASDHALYLTINDVERDGRRRPFEIFINTRNLEHYAWTVALTRMISAVFRRGGDVTFVVDELKAIFDPQGGQWMGGRYVPSLLAAIGEVIEAHMVRIGFLQRASSIERSETMLAAAAGHHTGTAAGPSPGPSDGSAHTVSGGSAQRFCPRCQQRAFVFQSGCWSCRECGYSKCG
jgi:ribonucleoside-diphosphate reductase alpha chain